MSKQTNTFPIINNVCHLIRFTPLMPSYPCKDCHKRNKPCLCIFPHLLLHWLSVRRCWTRFLSLSIFWCSPSVEACRHEWQRQRRRAHPVRSHSGRPAGVLQRDRGRHHQHTFGSVLSGSPGGGLGEPTALHSSGKVPFPTAKKACSKIS